MTLRTSDLLRLSNTRTLPWSARMWNARCICSRSKHTRSGSSISDRWFAPRNVENGWWTSASRIKLYLRKNENKISPICASPTFSTGGCFTVHVADKALRLWITCSHSKYIWLSETVPSEMSKHAAHTLSSLKFLMKRWFTQNTNTKNTRSVVFVPERSPCPVRRESWPHCEISLKIGKRPGYVLT